MPAAEEMSLLHGTLDVLVLKALTWGPRHGYSVARWIKDQSDRAIVVEDRALYVALHRLEEQGWVKGSWGISENNRKARYYELTTKGRQQLRAKTGHWDAYVRAIFKVLRSTEAPA
jgi:transcriptional regulator